jgi:RNA polymerase sigma-70 factor (ECF subfamily)
LPSDDKKTTLGVTFDFVSRTSFMQAIEQYKTWSEWMAKAQGGDQSAYRDLLNAIGPHITRWIRFYFHDAESLQDVYQDVLLNVHRARHTYDPERPFKPWLYSVTRHTVFDHLRKLKRAVPAEALIENMVEAAPSEPDGQEQKLLQNALAELPESQRMAVELIKLQGLSLAEAAANQNVSLAAMKVRAHRGYQALEKILFLRGQGWG